MTARIDKYLINGYYNYERAFPRLGLLSANQGRPIFLFSERRFDLKEEKRILQKHVKEINKPFRKYDVQNYDELSVQGDSFPVNQLHKDLKIKDNRQPKEAMMNSSLPNQLRNNGISINQKEEELLEELLPYINYYRLSVFRLFVEKDNKTFTRMYEIYEFDNYLREQIWSLLVTIEIAIKTTLAYSVSLKYKNDFHEEINNGEKFEALCYIDPRIYKSKSRKNLPAMLSSYASMMLDKQDKDPSIKHHVEYYSGNIPFWVIVEHLTMGNVVTFLYHLNRSYRKNWVRSSGFSINDKWIIPWVETIQFLRNTCAHTARIYGRRFNYNPHISDSIEQNIQPSHDEYALQQLKHTLFAALCVIKEFYITFPQNEQNTWNNFLDNLNTKITNSNINLYYMGFPDNWFELLIIND